MAGKTVRLGFQAGTGHPVDIPIRHMAVTGQTQESGKTTTLEALVARSGVRALAFVTKRGEGTLSAGHRVQPYFRDRADWQFVTSIIDATLQEKNKFLRPWIMKICRTTRTLAEVQRRVREALATAKGINEGVYTQLDAYLDLIVPEIARTPLASGLDLEAGLNVMDVSGSPTPMQMLFVQSALDWINEREENTIVVIPEAWEFVPEGKGSPVKASAIALVRKGAGLGNYLWLDSQDMAGVDKTLLRGCAVWLIGVQRESNEIKRNLSNIPQGISRPSATNVALLGKGRFYACWGSHVVAAYVQPAWMSDETAKAISLSTNPKLPPAPPRAAPKEDPMAVSQREADLERENRDLRKQLSELSERFDEQHAEIDRLLASSSPSSNHKAAGRSRGQDGSPEGQRETAPSGGNAGWTPAGDEDALYQRFLARLRTEDPAALLVAVTRPSVEVEVRRERITVDGRSLRGRIARLIANGFFEKARTSTDINDALVRNGWERSPIALNGELKELTEIGFFTRENKWFNLVPGMEVNVVER